MAFNKETGEINITSSHCQDVDTLLTMLKDANEKLNFYKDMSNYAKHKLLGLVKCYDSKTARVQSDTLKCKIELPSKVTWDQKKLSHIYSVYPHGTLVDNVVKIASYKVDMREYKKIINTVGTPDFNKFKEELIAANLGIIGAAKFTIEEV